MAFRLVCVIALVLVVATPASADRRQAIDNRIEQLRAKIADARTREGVLTSQISAVTNKIRTLEADVDGASSRLATLESDLAVHEARLAKLTELYRLQTQRFKLLRRQHELAQARLNQRLVDIYQSEDPNSLEVVLAAASFQELLDQLDYLSQIGDRDHAISLEVEAAKVEVRKARAATQKTRSGVAAATRAIAARTAEQREQHERLLASQNALVSARSEKQDTLEAVEQSEEEYLHEVAGLEKASAQLAARIQASQSGSTTAPAASTPTAPSSSGFVWPVSGPVTSTFGWRWGRMHEGIDIAAANGTPIVASASGTVIYATWMSGYGNLVVIDHGGGLATAYAHLSGYATSTGISVGQGQTIGYVGCTGNCFGFHVHFEVRVNGSAVDPLGYL